MKIGREEGEKIERDDEEPHLRLKNCVCLCNKVYKIAIKMSILPWLLLLPSSLDSSFFFSKSLTIKLAACHWPLACASPFIFFSIQNGKPLANDDDEAPLKIPLPA